MTTAALLRFAEFIDPVTAHMICVAGFIFCAVVIAAAGIVALLGDLTNDAT